MLKTNSKRAKENLKAVMIREVSGWDEDPKTAEEAAFILAHDFIEAAKGPNGKIDPYYYDARTFQDAFTNWGRGLTNHIFDKLFYFGDARALVAEVLEESEQETNKYSEDRAAVLFCALMWMHGGVSEAFYKIYRA